MLGLRPQATETYLISFPNQPTDQPRHRFLGWHRLNSWLVELLLAGSRAHRSTNRAAISRTDRRPCGRKCTAFLHSQYQSSRHVFLYCMPFCPMAIVLSLKADAREATLSFSESAMHIPENHQTLRCSTDTNPGNRAFDFLHYRLSSPIAWLGLILSYDGTALTRSRSEMFFSPSCTPRGFLQIEVSWVLSDALAYNLRFAT